MRRTLASMLIATGLFGAGQLPASVPGALSFQGYLSDAAGQPLDEVLEMHFSIYTVPAGGSPLWMQTQLVTLAQGLMSVELGGPTAPFPADLFETPLWLGIAVADDAEMTPRRALTSVGFAFTAEQAALLDGKTAGDLDQSEHVAATDNPHEVTPEQIGAAADAAFATHAGDSDAHHARFAPSEAVLAMGPPAPVNPLNHHRYSDADAVAAVIAGGGAGSGVDADSVDGLEAATFVRNDLDAVIQGDLNADFITGTGLRIQQGGTLYFGDGTTQTSAAPVLAGQGCAPGLSVIGFQANGSLLCGGGLPPSGSVLSSEEVFLNRSNLAIDDNGLPLVAYLGDPGGGGRALFLIRCATPDCMTFAEYQLPSVDWLSGNLVLDIGADGLPVMAYFDDISARVLHCENESCSQRSENTVYAPSSIGQFATLDLAIGGDGFPILSVYMSDDLVYIDCDDAACSPQRLTVTAVDSAASDLGEFNTIMTNDLGFGTIAYRDFLNTGQIKYVRCLTETCDQRVTAPLQAISINDRIGDIAITSSGDPLICYTNGSDLLLLRCLNENCATVLSKTLDSMGNVGASCDITLSQNRPLISYVDQSNDRVKVLHCDNVACSAGSIKSVVGTASSVSTGAAGGDTEILLAGDGLPVVLTVDQNNAVRVVDCGRPDCTPP